MFGGCLYDACLFPPHLTQSNYVCLRRHRDNSAINCVSLFFNVYFERRQSRHGPWDRSLIGYLAPESQKVALTAAAALLLLGPHRSASSYQVTSLSCDIFLIYYVFVEQALCLPGCLTFGFTSALPVHQLHVYI